MSDLRNYWTQGRIERGRLELLDPEGFRRAMWRMRPGPVVIRVDQPVTKRSLDQNAYWHAAVFPPIAEHCGYTIPECKLVLMGECFGWHTVGGHEIPIQPSTSELTVEQGTYFTDWVIPWAQEHLGVRVPLPNEYLESVS